MASIFDQFLLPEPEPKTTWVQPPPSAVFGNTSIAYPEGTVDFGTTGSAIADSRDLHRVLELPRREPLVITDASGRRSIHPELTSITQDLTVRLSKGDVACQCEARFLRRCARNLLPIQVWALHEAAQCEGLLGPIGVGDGKTLLDLLTPMIMPGCRTAVLLVQPGLRDQLLKVDLEFYQQHWHLPNVAGSGARKGFAYPDRPWLHVVAFSELSGAKSSDLLDRIEPDLVIVDEAHNLRRREAARTKRFLRYFSAHRSTRLCAWSGTLTSKSIKDYAHLSNLALREGSPTPLHWPTVEEWAGAIDPSDLPSPIGALTKLCEVGEHVQTGWRRRLHATRGVVSSPETGNCNASLVFAERKMVAPPEVLKKIEETRATWTRPDGEELVDAMSLYRCLRELACGFFYRWRWPRMEPVPIIDRWLSARKDWHREMRERLKRSGPHMDSPLLLAKAALRWYEGYAHIDAQGTRHEIPPFAKHGPMPVWPALSWPEWVQVRDTARPETEAVWVDEFLARDAAEWVKSEKGILWYEHDAFGRKVHQLSQAPFYGPGAEASARILEARGDKGCVVSIRAHGTGRNLQIFSLQLVANPPADGAVWEQLIGRTHRQGQIADEVRVLVYRHTEDMRAALDKARTLAAYIQETLGGSQKLRRATYLWSE